MKKRTKVMAGIGAFILIGVILFFTSAFVGNPVSKFLANRSAKAYIGETSGNIVLYIEDEEVNVERASEILIHIKDIFDEKDIPFYAIDFSLEEAKKVDDKKFEDRRRFNVGKFLYSDIYQEGLVERLGKSAKDLEEYYEREDSKKEKLNY